jgi:hypothetical protein
VLYDRTLAEQIEKRLVEDIKEYFRYDLKSNRNRQSLTPEFLEAVKGDVAILGQEVVFVRREIAAAAAKLYDSLFQHTGAIAREIDSLLRQLGKKSGNNDEDEKIFGEIAQQLLVLVTGYRLDAAIPERLTATPYNDVFADKKRDALVSVIDLVQGERRAFTNRRSGQDRRKFRLILADTADRRSNQDRRSGRDRRDEAPAAYA